MIYTIFAYIPDDALCTDPRLTPSRRLVANQKSRQEFEPVIGELINHAHVDPLHLKNNACTLAHRNILHVALSMSKLPNSVTSFAQVPSASLFFKYVETLRSKCCLSRLAKKIIRWFSETKGNGKDFDYRLQAKTLVCFFTILCSLLEENSLGMQSKQLHIHAYLCLCLRNAVSLFSKRKYLIQISGKIEFR